MVDTTTPASGWASRNTVSSIGPACTALVRNSDMKGNDRAVDSPMAKNTTASGPRARERMRIGAAVVVAVTSRHANSWW